MAGIGLGRLLGGEHASIPPECGGGSSPVKTEPPQIVFFLFFLFFFLFLSSPLSSLSILSSSQFCQYLSLLQIQVARSPLAGGSLFSYGKNAHSEKVCSSPKEKGDARAAPVIP